MKIHPVELTNRDRLILAISEGQTILEAAEEAGLRLPVGCRFGACITCAAKLIRGTVDQAPAKCLKPDQIAAGYVLLCVAQPRSDCQFEVGVESQISLFTNPFQS